MNQPSLGASLIVKDEAVRLPACLASLRGVVDEIVVYDTGSTDGSPEIAEQAGATVCRGEWPGSFAAARNRALELSTADWVLTVDADEELVVPRPEELRNYLVHSRNRVFAVRIDNVVKADRAFDFSHHHTRLFRRDGLRWKGFVHEVVADDAGAVTPDGLDPALLSIVHHGYESREVVRLKGERNTRIVTEEVVRLAGAGSAADLDVLQPLLVDLIRSREGSGDRVGALAVARAMHDLLPREHPAWAQVTDQLVQLSLSAGRAGAVAPVLRRWRDHGADGPWVDFLDARIRVALGDRDRAAALFEKVAAAGVVEDTIGVRLTPERLREERAVLTSC